MIYPRNDKIILNTKVIDMRLMSSVKMFSDNTVNIISKGILDIYGGLIDFADGARGVIGSKGGPYPNETRQIRLHEGTRFICR